MENFFFGLQNVAHSIAVTVRILVRHQLVWGIALGFLISTIIHLMILNDNPIPITDALTMPPHKSFDKHAEKDERGAYVSSYVGFLREYNKVRIVFYSMSLVFLLVALTALIFY